MRLLVTACVAVFVLALCLAGYKRTTPPGPAPVYRVIPSSTIKSVDWYFDATASLQGFVSPQAGPSYINFVKTVEESLDSLYLQQASIQKHRFGTVSNTFSRLDDTFEPKFYSAAEGYKDTDLEVVGKALNPDGMTIIVTDLFQSNDHIEPFRAALLKKGLGTKFQFGVLALSAGFNGVLYDIPPPGPVKMPYQGPHPVYAIILGPQQQVRELIADVLRRGETRVGKDVVQGALLSSQLATPKVPLHELRDQETDPSHMVMTEVNSASDSERHIIEEGDVPPPFAMALDLPHVGTHPHLQYQTELQFEPFAVLPAHATTVQGWSLDTHVHVCSPKAVSMLDSIRHAMAWRHTAVPPSQAEPVRAEEPSVAGDSAAPEKTDPCPVSDTELFTMAPTAQVNPIPHGMQATLSVDLGNSKDRANPFKARPGYIYVVELKLVPNGQEYEFPSWVQTFAQQPGSKFSGLRTPNLLSFLSNMDQGVVKGQSPAALDDYLYVQSN